MRRRLNASAVYAVFTRTDGDARIPQAVVLLPMVADLIFRVIGSWTSPSSLSEAGGYALLVVATVLAIAFGNRVREPWLIAAVPVIDIAAIGLLRLTTISPIGVAIVLPAIWIALLLPRHGALVALVATSISTILPGFLSVGFSLTALDRAIEILLIVGLTSFMVALARTEWAEHRRTQDALLRTVDVGVLGLAADGTFSAMNPRQESFIAMVMPEGHGGYVGGSQHVYGRDGVTPLDEADLPTTRSLRGEEYSGYLLWIGGTSGERRAVSVSSRNLYDEDGAYDGAVLAYQDVTELMQALSVKDDFLASVSHELRTPLTSVVGYLDLLAEDVIGLSPVAHQNVERASRNAERLIRVVNDLLGDAHHAGFALERLPVRLDPIVQNAVTDLQGTARASGVSLRLGRTTDVVVSGDRDRLAMVTDNLVGNALKYSDPGAEVVVDLDCEPNGDVRLIVRDSGIGIDPAEHARLFERFYRSAEARRRALPGVGLGLATCKEIVEAHGGSIAVSSAPGQGSEFVVTLPRSSLATLPG